MNMPFNGLSQHLHCQVVMHTNQDAAADDKVFHLCKDCWIKQEAAAVRLKHLHVRLD